MFRIEGLPEMQRNLEKLSRNLQKLGGEHSIPLTELFPPAFMKANSCFGSIEEMLEAKGVATAEDFAALSDEEWDRFVVETTKFESWDEMQGRGAEEWVARRLDM